MGHTAAQLKSAIAGFMHRDPQVFIRPSTAGATGYLTDDQGNRITDSDGNAIVLTLPGHEAFDLLLNAMNNARLYAERRVDFELAVEAVHIPNVTLASGGLITDAVLASDDTTAVSVKKIRTAYLPVNETEYFPVDLMSKKKWDDRQKARWEGQKPLDTAQYPYLSEAPFGLVQNGNQVFIAPPDNKVFASGSLTVAADVIAWLPDYAEGTETDFLLDFCFDWLMYRSIFELNFFLKEDERVQLSTALIRDAWDSLVIWNNELQAANVDDVSLD